MTAQKFGGEDYGEMKAWTRRTARGERKQSADGPKVWCSSVDAFKQLYSSDEPELLRTLEECALGVLPGSAIESAEGAR